MKKTEDWDEILKKFKVLENTMIEKHNYVLVKFDQLSFRT